VRPIRRTYERAVEELVESIADAFSLKELTDIVENGLIGVRQMSNVTLRTEWRIRFDRRLQLIDPESNPNGERDPTDEQ